MKKKNITQSELIGIIASITLVPLFVSFPLYGPRFFNIISNEIIHWSRVRVIITAVSISVALVTYLIITRAKIQFFDKISEKVAVLTINSSKSLLGNVVGGNRYYSTDAAISLTYLNHKKNEYKICKVILIISICVASIFSVVFKKENSSVVIGVLFGYMLFVMVKEFVLEYRIKTGRYGGNYHEAKDIILFLVTHSKQINFTDSTGGPKKALLPEKNTYNHQVQSIPGGATI